jgi:NMD protein affecting ribosome stability and mRNA decay
MGKGSAQHAFCCPCGRPEILALGLCASCYTMKRQDEAYFGGLREAVLARDCYRCRGAGLRVEENARSPYIIAFLASPGWN